MASVLAHPNQKGNPMLRHLKGVACRWGGDDCAWDYELRCARGGAPRGVVFLSLRYHCAHPAYLPQRLRRNPEGLEAVNAACLDAGLALLVAWDAEEAAALLLALAEDPK
eukprot:gene3618-4906_t